MFRRLAFLVAAFIALATPTLPASSDVWVGYMAQGEELGSVVVESTSVAPPADQSPDCVWFNGVCFIDSGLNGSMPISE